MIKKMICSILIGLTLFMPVAGCGSMSLSPDAPKEVFEQVLASDARKTKALTSGLVGAYLLTIDNPSKRAETAKNLSDIAADAKEFASQDVANLSNLRLLAVQLIANSSMNDKEAIMLLLNSVAILVEDQMTTFVEVPTDRKDLARQTLVLAACDGVIDAAKLYGQAR
jgi:hypothetical protein